ncbi:MAG TPA: uracil-DNA glycosylase [Candidatus Faeciplasma pullistercoris]|uniref:Uracil-DNA glycosylase n=1 Tax=Candidatus Faeciplasma pullistercoris TaxID=2840800 RepID=A0A9D1GU19_9FIRM|nr:uracil-DNA glycosylase [Candidatus Faeciplasma pullistercoris]
MVVIGNDWDEIIGEEFKKDYYIRLREFLKEEYAKHTVYPDMHSIFNALKLTPYKDVRVVILGQDPYHEPNQAHGLCFSVQDGTPLPPSLKNIYKELEADLGIPPSKSGDLTKWAKQGILLLNTVLTVRRGEANSHKGKGWELLTDEIIRKLNDKTEPVVFILWGANARSKKSLITNPIHGIIESAHPSPLSAFNGFFGSRPFSRANKFLILNRIPPINWKP